MCVVHTYAFCVCICFLPLFLLERLCTDLVDDDTTRLPSPEQLKGKILIKVSNASRCLLVIHTISIDFRLKIFQGLQCVQY